MAKQTPACRGGSEQTSFLCYQTENARVVSIPLQTSEISQKKSDDRGIKYILELLNEAINSGINLDRDFGFNHTVSGADLWSR